MTDLRIEALRGGITESVHRLSVAVVTAEGRLAAAAGDPDLVTFWRSAAKPFQAMPLVEDGVLDAFGLGSEELALACASHSSEALHLAIADRFLARIGATESDLACGTHVPLGLEVAREVEARGTTLTPRWSNCSGKHAGMLALARHHGWPTGGYERAGHPVQDRMLHSVTRWTSMPADRIGRGVDGCTTVCFALPLRAMALAWARLGVSDDPAAAAVRDAMLGHPDLVAGAGRFCTEVMQAWPGGLIAKVGAAGIYSATLPFEGLGIALKVEDGDFRVAPTALLAVLGQLVARDWSALARFEVLPVTSTRGEQVGAIRAAGALRRFDA